MAETGLLPALPFQPAGATQGKSVVTLAKHRSIASIAVFKDCQMRLQDVLGVALPTANRQLHSDGILYLWAGPESWLALSDSADPDFGPNLAERCDGLAAITDQGDGRTILRIAGPGARTALAKLLPIDLHPNAFAPDATAMTLAGHISIQIWRVPEDGFELSCFRSFSETLYEALAEATRY